MIQVYILLGSNMGDRKSILTKACEMIEWSCGKIVRKSSLYESQPWGFETEKWFLNQLVVVETDLSADELMERLLQIETALGRMRNPEAQGYSSRTADIDILYYSNMVIETALVQTPHPRLHLRRFALLPMCEVNPDFIHPTLHLSQRELLDVCPDKLEVRII